MRKPTDEIVAGLKFEFLHARHSRCRIRLKLREIGTLPVQKQRGRRPLDRPTGKRSRCMISGAPGTKSSH